MIITTKHTGKSLQELKKLNRSMIVRLLRKQEMSGRELSKVLKLSPAGIQSLIDEMVEEGLLIKQNAEKVVRGRRPINISINPTFGAVALINFSSADEMGICFCDFKGNKLYQVERQLDEDSDALAMIIADIEAAVALTGKQLYAISIITSGKVHKDTGAFHYAPAMEHFQKINFKQELEAYFHVGVTIKTRTIFLLRSERKCQYNSDYRNCMYIYDLGCALCIDGRIFEGDKGFAGELGVVNIDIYGSLNETHYYNPYRSNYFMSAFTGMVDAVHKNSNGELSNNITHREIFSLYNEGNAVVREPVETFLRICGKTIRNFVEFLDLRYVVVGGLIATLSDEALSLLSKFINESIHDILSVEVVRANSKCDCWDGAFEYAMDTAFSKILE